MISQNKVCIKDKDQDVLKEIKSAPSYSLSSAALNSAGSFSKLEVNDQERQSQNKAENTNSDVCNAKEWVLTTYP